MLFRNHGSNQPDSKLQWEDLNDGAPTIIAFANLCSHAMSQPDIDLNLLLEKLTPEAKTILVAAVDRGTMDIRASREQVDSAERFLAICVEDQPDHRMLFLNRMQPEQTIRFLEGFRQLCAFGLVIHHLQKDFSLSANGFEVARKLKKDDFRDLLDFATEIEH